ncbi:GL21712 [Drosophila persimilis]|uniref:DNA/RNA non-specific endonuclease/pyrophosphatase/phosphodiesterase domain-containing protein n=2 Tax=pseudoobscura subgroup TaxID=32358 RepID=Q29DK1_DROPS|nr:uncharacterized protein LOC4812079 [Drosophila pseudoobscura]XP_002026573.1 uncharacterized protein LOC6601511 [Drosophila persimilis]EDW33532.1 GL21712 [Drosophila persimilis]
MKSVRLTLVLIGLVVVQAAWARVPYPEVELPPIVQEDEIYERAVYVAPQPEGRAAACSVAIRGALPSPQPVYLKTDSEDFYPFNDVGVMEFNAGDSFQLWCPGAFNTHSETLLTAKCVSGSTFSVDGKDFEFKDLYCKAWPGFKAIKSGATCNGGVVIRVGFEITSTRFAEQMQICFNEEEEVTRYTRHKLEPGSNYYETGVARITFQTAGYFDGKNVDKLYTQVTQMETINKDLGGDADQYFDTATNVFLARGHLGAKADFDYAPEQRATFLFINAAPQWQTFNAGNWARVEDGLRAWVSKNKMNVNCYTGVWGVTTLPNKDGVETPLYLARDANNNGLIPVPKLYFRVVIEPSTHRGIVFVGVNNPHLSEEQIKRDYVLCDDVSDQVTYINWKKDDIKTGWSYACEVADFLKTVKHLPALTAKGGLLV